MTREYFGLLEWDEMQGFRNTLGGPGDSTSFHAHTFPHVALFWLGDGAEYEVIKREHGREVEVPVAPLFDGSPWVGIGYAEIKAGVAHRIGLKAGSRGAFICMFQRYSPLHGQMPRHDPLGEREVF